MTVNTSKKRKQQQSQATTRIVIMAAILVCVNMLAARFHYGFDLTSEKRFTLSPSTRKMLDSMKEVAVVDIYLTGKLPSSFQHLKDAAAEQLQSFKEVAGKHIIYKFVDPLEGKEGAERQTALRQMNEKGVRQIELHKYAEGDYSETKVFPYALVQYNGRELAVRLIEDNPSMSDMEVLNFSETKLEYKFATAIHNMIVADRPRVAYITGNGEPLGMNTIDLLTTMSFLYHVDTLDITKSFHISEAYDAIIVNKPTQRMDDKQKFSIDQYVMSGGHVLWMVDQVNASLDSLSTSPQFIAMDMGLNLDDMLFKYGVRINTDIIEDNQCVVLPINVGMRDGEPVLERQDWIYFPKITPTSKHPIVNNMDAILGKFVSSIDTIADPGVKKTILLESSKYSRVAPTPARISLSMAMYKPTLDMYNKPYRPIAVLLEGKFKSVYQNRLPPGTLRLMDSLHHPFIAANKAENSMIVVSDGDIMLNDYTVSTGPYHLGYWKYTKELFSNKAFVLNCLEFLTDRSGLLEARSKQQKLRLLDEGRIKSEKTQWQIVNLAVPIAAVLIFASAYLFFRKRRYEVKTVSEPIKKT